MLKDIIKGLDLKDLDLEKLTGGVNWQNFASELIEQVKDGNDDGKYTALLNAAKAKDWAKLGKEALPLIQSGDSLLNDILKKSK